MFTSKLNAALALLLAATSTVNAQANVDNTTVAGNATGPNSDGKYTIQAEGIRANFIPYGASISNLFINDTHGIERDIVLGFDNASYYSIDRQHPHLGGVPGKSRQISQLQQRTKTNRS